MDEARKNGFGRPIRPIFLFFCFLKALRLLFSVAISEVLMPISALLFLCFVVGNAPFEPLPQSQLEYGLCEPAFLFCLHSARRLRRNETYLFLNPLALFLHPLHLFPAEPPTRQITCALVYSVKTAKFLPTGERRLHFLNIHK